MTEIRDSGASLRDDRSASERSLPEEISARAHRLMEEHLEAIVAAVVQCAEEGGMPAAKLVLDRVAPAPGDRRVFFSMRRLDGGKDAIGAASDVLAAVAEGKITVTEASGILKLLNGYMKISAIQELEARLAAVEAALPSSPNVRPQILRNGSKLPSAVSCPHMAS